MKRAVVYYITNPQHLPYLVVSANSLRRFWGGEIIVGMWPESLYTATMDLTNSSLKFNIQKDNHCEDGRKNEQELCKIRFLDRVKELCDECIYLDADTLIVQDISRLFDEIEDSPGAKFVATQFGDWDMTVPFAHGRVSRMLGNSQVNQDSVERALDPSAPSVNSGVLATRAGEDLLKTWYKYTWATRMYPIAGEAALHVAVAEHVAQVLLGGEYNCSTTRFRNRHLNDEDVKIWHFHGGTGMRPDKSPKGFEIWWPEYQKVLADNVAGIQSWRRLCRNKYLDKLESGQ